MTEDQQRIESLELRVTALEGVVAGLEESRGDRDDRNIRVETLRLVLKQIALTLPEKFRPPEADWEKTGALSRAINAFMENKIKSKKQFNDGYGVAG